MDRYVALFHQAESGAWGVSFPDFPGCISGGDTFEEALDKGAQSLRFHVEGMLADGDAVPPPTPLEQLRADPEFVDDFQDVVIEFVPLPASWQDRADHYPAAGM